MANLFPRRRLKFLASINDEALTEETDDDAEIQYIDIGNVDSGGNIHEIAQYKFSAAPSRARRVVRDGDVIISTVRTYLQAIAYISEPPQNLIVSTGFAVVRPGKELFDAGYCKYALREKSFLNEVVTRSTGVSYPAINASEIGNIPVCLPPLPAQRRIADFLDRETAQIDALITAKEQMLALLQEKRAAQISQMVTKGLNPDAQMKDSGLAWLGEVPAHWEVRRIKHVAKVGNGSTPSRENLAYWEGGTYPWLNSSVVNQEVVEEASRYVTELALIECHLPKIVPPAVLVGITGQGKTRGSSAILTFEATINQHIAYIKPTEDIDVFYLSELMDVAYEYLRNESEGNGGTKGAITCEQLANFFIVTPPSTEQAEVKQAVKLYDQRYLGMESDLNFSISLLRERRGALITAAVTGQLPEVLA